MLKNQRIDLGDGVDITIRMKNVPKETRFGTARVSIFDIGPDSEIHRRPMYDETVRIPASRPENMTDRYFGELCDSEYARAKEARGKNENLRTLAKHYADTGVIQIVHDPFAQDVVPDYTIDGRVAKARVDRENGAANSFDRTVSAESPNSGLQEQPLPSFNDAIEADPTLVIDRAEPQIVRVEESADAEESMRGKPREAKPKN
jgi:hypothetical protein